MSLGLLLAGAIAASAVSAPTLSENDGNLTWNAVGGADGYNVYLDDSYLATVTATRFTAPRDGVYYVTSFDRDTNPTSYSGRSNEVSVEPSDGGSEPPPPTDTRLSAPTLSVDGERQLTWNAVSRADGYNVYLGDSYLTTVTATRFTASRNGVYSVTSFDRDTNPTSFSGHSNDVTVPSSGGSDGGDTAVKRNDKPEFRRFADTPSSALNFDALVKNADPAADPSGPGAAAREGNFRMECEWSHFAQDDPIVSPGQHGQSDHLHMFFGNTRTDASSTGASLVASGGGTCDGYELNRSAYWMPALLDANGNPVEPANILVYYKTKPVGSHQPANVQKMPQGLELVAGDANGSNPDLDNVFWSCGSNRGVPDGEKMSSIPDTCGSGRAGQLNATIHFPQCWDGSQLEFTERFRYVHQVTMDESCDPGFVRLPRLGILVYWPAQTSYEGYRLSSDKPGAVAGGSLHADWIGGWHDGTQDQWLGNCLRGSQNCNFGQLGYEKRLKQVADRD